MTRASEQICRERRKKRVQSLKSNVQSQRLLSDFGHWTLDFGLVLFPHLAREHRLVYSLGIAEDDEANVTHVLLHGSLHVCWRHGSQVREHVESSAPAAAD